ncbi:hypothetical protein [Georgenia subflava]|uniref:Uncharacterized protein n=1 Tax=Georgenia subflava TaxID=1622177 RepID=A0A6N7ENW5_9MICO|nr:hypothetical protein [Georgenia subflava]MPV38803.1 hypothetical protein [Georgenia subflava]
MSPAFDVRAYARAPDELRPTDLDLDTLRNLGGPSLAVLTYLWRTEGGDLDGLRDVLVTPTHADPRVTAFLITRSYEQHWLAESLRSILAANGHAPVGARDTALGRARRTWDERGRPVVAAVGTNLLGADVTAAQMVTGWLDTAALALAYRRLADLEPSLAAVAAAVDRIKGRHLAFYADEAVTRLARSSSARRIAGAAVARWRWPGARRAGTGAVRPVVTDLLAGPRSRPADDTIDTIDAIDAIDDSVATFPGLAGARPVHAALDRLAGRCSVFAPRTDPSGRPTAPNPW